MRILVTGHKGFIGSNMALYLQSQGHDVEGWEYTENVIPNPEPYDLVIHLGAISSTTFSDVHQILEQNFEFSIKLIQACNRLGINFQYASSASVYGPTTAFKEDGPVLPQSPYAWSKYLFDRFIEMYKDEFTINVQGFRYFNVYGPNENHKGDQASPYTKFISQATQSGKIKLFEGSFNFKRDFVCVEDLCKVHEKFFDVGESGIFNIGTGTATSFEAVANAIANKYDAEVEYIPMPENLKSQYQKYTCADLTKLSSKISMDWVSIENYIDETK